MLYQAYQAHADLMVPVRALASLGASRISPPFTENLGIARNIMAACELIARTKLTHHRLPFGIDTVMVGNREVAVREEAIRATPFGTLLHFKKDIDMMQPRVLLVAPLSGHFATLLRATVNTMLADHDVYITDWHNVRDVALFHGGFGFDDYIQHLIDFLEAIGPAAQHDPDGRADRYPRPPHQGQRTRQLKADFVVRAKPDCDRADAISRRIPPCLSWVCAARCLHEHEHRTAHQGPQGALREPPRRRDREGRDHQSLLRRIFCRAGPCGGVLSRNRKAGVSGTCVAARETEMARRTGGTARHPPHHVADRRGRARRHLRGRPNHGGARTVQRTAAVHAAPSHAGRRWPLRRFQRPPLDRPDLPHPAQRYSVQRVTSDPLPSMRGR